MITRKQLIFTLSISLLMTTMPARKSHGANVYFEVRDLLADFFKNSKRVVYETVDTANHAERLRNRLGYLPERKRFVVFIGLTGATVDGFAVVDNENGRYDPITFGIRISEDLKVNRTEVMVYRGPIGDGIRSTAFLNQFIGKGGKDKLTPSEADIVTGATISSKSVTAMINSAIGDLRQPLTDGSAADGKEGKENG